MRTANLFRSRESQSLGLFQSEGYNASMKSSDVLRVIADVTASQWGMVTAAQAGALGVSRLALARLAEAGHLERLAHGVYRDAGAPSDGFEDLRAAWLSAEPRRLAEERLGDLKGGVVVASSSAALLHGIGDLWASRQEFVAAKRRQTQRAEIRYRQRSLEERDVTLVEGLPVMTLERTLADLLEDMGELSLVADALGSAVKKQSLDLDRLRNLLSPLAERNGFKRYDGNAVLEYLLEIAGLDLDTVARRISADPALSSRILANYMQHAVPSIEMPDLSGLVKQVEPLLPEVPAGLVEGILEAVRPQLAIDEKVWRSLVDAVSPNLSRTVAEIVNTPALANISQQWPRDLEVLPVPATACRSGRAGEVSDE